MGDRRINSLTRKIFLKISPPGNGDIIGDQERILNALTHKFGTVRFSYRVLKKIYPLCRDANWEISLTLIQNGKYWEIVELEAGDMRHRHLGIAVDLGSTSVAMKIVDLNTGIVLGEDSILNHQIQYGDDILTRIFYTKNRVDHLQEVQAATVDTFNELLDQLGKKARINPRESCIMVVSGNTTMIHFLLGIDPWPVFEYPFAPVFNHTGYLDAQDLGLATSGYLYCMPSVANYLGGDTVSGLLVAGLHEKDELGLFIDIGTNGEMVLGNKDFLFAGAGAAGPALEGGISKNGMKATSGAVDSVVIEDNMFRLTTIGGSKPLGICGSGIVDLIAQMLLGGWIDFSGRFNHEKSERIVKRDGEYGVLYASREESGSGEELLFTQTDMSQFIDTKAAASTMVAYLLERLGMKPMDIDRLYVSGAFGTYINLESAITIGLYPDLPRERYVSLGNSSLNGAYTLLTNEEKMAEVAMLQQRIEYLEFGAATDFISRMYASRFLPHTDFDLYPSVKAALRKQGRLR
nr:ASKHA domain-containing protein [uncultured Acetobacterium sp.]